MKSQNEAHVTELPMCDFCLLEGEARTDARYDGRTKQGPWGYMCEKHFTECGVGLGLGRGQKLILKQGAIK